MSLHRENSFALRGCPAVQKIVIFLQISVRIFRTEQHNHNFNHEDMHSETGYTETAVLVPCRFQSRFSAQWNTPFTQRMSEGEATE